MALAGAVVLGSLSGEIRAEQRISEPWLSQQDLWAKLDQFRKERDELHHARVAEICSERQDEVQCQQQYEECLSSGQSLYMCETIFRHQAFMAEHRERMAETVRDWYNRLSPEHQQQYRNCLAQGSGSDICMSMVGYSSSRGPVEEINRLSVLCAERNEQDACRRLGALMAHIEAQGATMDLMNRALDGASRIHQGVRQQEQRVQDRNQGAHDRGMARGYYQWADQARQRGDRAAAERYQHQGDYHQRRALED